MPIKQLKMKKIIILLFFFKAFVANAQINNPNFKHYKLWLDSITIVLSKIDTVTSLKVKSDSIQYLEKLKKIESTFFDTTLLFKKLSNDTSVISLELKKSYVLANLASLHYDIKKFGLAKVSYSDIYAKTTDPIEKEIVYLEISPLSNKKFFTAFDPESKRAIFPIVADYKRNTQ